MTRASTAVTHAGVGAEQHSNWQAAVAATLDWWSDAGVDMLVEDAPRDWLAAPVARPAAAPPAPAVPAALPSTLAAFLAWRGGADTPEAGWPGAAIPAAGPANAALMVLVDCPERDDEGELMGGAAGRLFDRMLAAIGLARGEVHLAALCAKRPTAARLPGDQHERLVALARHHVALVAPRRVLVMGNSAVRAMLGQDVAPARGLLHRLALSAALDHPVDAVASHHPRFLLDHPAAKAGAWADLRLVRQGLLP